LDALCPTRSGQLPWRSKPCQTVTSGRTGLKLVAQILKASSNGSCLLPSYLCSSMIRPFDDEGAVVEFYRVNADLTIDVEDLESRVRSTRPSSVLFVNYFGFPVSDREAETLRRIKQHCWVIEDCAHGSLIERGDPIVGGIGHFVVTSFRKYLPVPDGGLVINWTDLPMPQLPAPTGSFVRHRVLAKSLRHEYLHGGLDQPELEDAYLSLFSAAETRLDSDVPMHAMSAISERLMSAMDVPAVMDCRRRNYNFLLQAFNELPLLKTVGIPIRTDLPDGVSPLVFPIRVNETKRDLLRRELASCRVFCPIHWPLPSDISENRYPEAYELSRQILGLPIDQRYGEDDMQSLVERLIKTWGRLP